jgi:hypothetical protein
LYAVASSLNCFRDLLEFKSVDAGHGWLIFALPSAEAAFHPSEEDLHEL